MAVKKLQNIYRGADLNAPANGIMYFRIEEQTVITKITIVADANLTGDAIFNLNLAGTDLLAGTNRPKILAAADRIVLSGLNLPAGNLDKCLLQLQSLTAGVVKSPITLIIESDEALVVIPFNDIAWQNFVNSSLVGGVLKKSTANVAWDAGASSVEKISTVGMFRFTIVYDPAAGSARMFGLSYVDSNASFTTMNFAVNTSDSGIYELGSSPGTMGGCVISDVFDFKVYLNGTNQRCVDYIKNGLVKRTVTNIAAGDLIFDCSIYGGNAFVETPQLRLDS